MNLWLTWARNFFFYCGIFTFASDILKAILEYRLRRLKRKRDALLGDNEANPINGKPMKL